LVARPFGRVEIILDASGSTSHVSVPTRRKAIRRIAFRTGRGLGDAVLCEPLVRRLAEVYAGVEIAVLAPGSCRGIERLGYAGTRFLPWREHKSLGNILDDYDLIIDADPAEYSEAFHSTTASGADLVRLFAHYRPEAERTTAYERMAEGLARIGVDAVTDYPQLCVPDLLVAEAGPSLEGLRVDRDALVIVIHPGSNAGYSFKRWMPAGFAAVADALIERLGAGLVVVGSGSEESLIEEIRGGMRYGDRMTAAYDRSLLDLAVLLRLSALFIGNDSGVGHLAAALGRPTVTIAGPTFAHFWAPMTDRALVVDPDGCCYEPEKCGVRCLRSISPSQVIGAAEALLFATRNAATETFLDAIAVAPDLEITHTSDDSVVLRSAGANLPLAVEHGKDYVLEFLQAVDSTGSTAMVRSAFAEADILIEQSLRYGIVVHDQPRKGVRMQCQTTQTTPGEVVR
jgi:ADP-heptose:LPS heptosyltransferase